MDYSPSFDFSLTDDEYSRAAFDLDAYFARRAWLSSVRFSMTVARDEFEYEQMRGVRVRVAERGGHACLSVRGLHCKTHAGGVRGVITEFSRRSRQALSDAVNEISSSVSFVSFVTLTFPAVWSLDGACVKRCFKRWMKNYKRRMGRYIWFLEFQRRGAPHFHVITEGRMTKAALRAWCRIVRDELGLSGDDFRKMLAHHSRPEVCQELRSRDGGLRYAVKYAAKMRQKIVPKEYQNVGRFWGMSRGMRVVLVYHVPLNQWDDVRSGAFVAANAAPWLFGQKSGEVKSDCAVWLCQTPAICARGRVYGRAGDFLEFEILSRLGRGCRVVVVGAPPCKSRRRNV